MVEYSFPLTWEKYLKPFVNAAKDIMNSYPIASYYMLLFVLHEAILFKELNTSHLEEDKQSVFIERLFVDLEQLKATTDLTKDMRVELTKTGLELFSKAENLECSGENSISVAKLFYLSSYVLIANIQCIKDYSQTIPPLIKSSAIMRPIKDMIDQLIKWDPIIGKRIKYAQIMSAKIKRKSEETNNNSHYNQNLNESNEFLKIHKVTN